MIKAASHDKELVLDILTESFDSNKSVNFVVKQDGNRKQRIRDLMSYSFDVCYEYGAVFLTKEKNACALVLYPETKKTTFKTILWDITLIFRSVGILNISRILRREIEVKSNHPHYPFIYLWYIGVRTAEQKKGVGSNVMSHILNLSESLQRPIFLETSMKENIGFYQKHGFKIYKELFFPYSLYLLKKQ